MDEITFFTAKNGSLSCSVNGITIHSSYNPEHEAERFAANLSSPFLPSFIIITEPAVSYCADFLRQRFPDAKLCAVRYTRAFEDYDRKWDCVFHLEEKSDFRLFEENLFNELGEEGICTCISASWPPSAKAFAETDSAAWNAIRNATIKSRTVLFSRSYFAERSLRNACVFCRSIKNTAALKKGSQPIIITASGPSLGTSVSLLKKYRNLYFLLAASSSLPVLLANSLIPDLVISTDPGWWAEKHLAQLIRYTDIPLAIPADGGCCRQILEKSTILPLRYDDGPEAAMAAACGITMMHADRNGTVSGTAAEFALSITTANVFICGLDLAEAAGFQHTQPNAIENCNSAGDSRLHTKELRQTSSQFNNSSLEIYRNWFSVQPESFSKRVFRLSNGYNFRNSLGKIRDVNFDFFLKEADRKFIKPEFIPCAVKYGNVQRSKKIAEFIEQSKNGSEWLHNAFPAEYLSWKRSADADNKTRKLEELNRKNSQLIEKLKKAADA